MTDALRALWLVVATLIPLAGAWAFAARVFRGRGLFDRLLFWLLSFVALLVLAFQLADLARPFSASSLFFTASSLSVVAIAWALEVVHPRELWTQLRTDLTAPRRLLADAWTEKEPALVLVGLALLGLGWCGWMVVFFRSWGWDVLMFHTTITNSIAQNGSLEWIETAFHQVKGYPRNVHLLAVWNVLFMGNTELDDAPQLPFGLIGALATAAWARRLGASRSFSASLGAAWLCFPAVLLQLPSVHVDVACGALLATGAYFASTWEDDGDRLASVMAFGLYLGSKHTGMFHLGFYAPILVVHFARALKASSARWATVRQYLGLAALIPVLGAFKYVQNALVRGNPVWPFKLTLPFLGELPWENDPSVQYGGPPGGRASFFGVPGEGRIFLEQLLKYDLQVYFPDVRDGYFGLPFTFLALPCLLLGLVALKDRERRWQPLALLFLVFAAISVPSAYWPRYSMSASIAGLVAIALVGVTLRNRVVQRALSLTLVALVLAQTWIVGKKLGSDPQYGWPALASTQHTLTAAQRATQQVVSWNWPHEVLELRDRVVQPGDVITFDEYLDFPGELFSPDLRARLVYVQTSLGIPTLAERIKAVNARFSIVAAAAAPALQQAGARPLTGVKGFVLVEWPR